MTDIHLPRYTFVDYCLRALVTLMVAAMASIVFILYRVPVLSDSLKIVELIVAMSVPIFGGLMSLIVTNTNKLTQQTKIVAEKTREVAENTHKIVNSGFDQFRTELRERAREEIENAYRDIATQLAERFRQGEEAGTAAAVAAAKEETKE